MRREQQGAEGLFMGCLFALVVLLALGVVAAIGVGIGFVIRIVIG